MLISSDPADGARLTAAPGSVTLVFDQSVRQGFAQISVNGPGGAAFADGTTAVSGAKATVKVKPLPAAGDYVIGYRILSSDGHPVSGKVTFTLTTAGAAAPAVQPSQAGRDLSAEAAEVAANGGAGMAVVWIGGALVLLAIGTVVAMRRGERA